MLQSEEITMGSIKQTIEEKACCQDWEPQIKIINDFIITQSMRIGRPNLFLEVGGKQFQFCPWCGAKKSF